MESEKYFVFPNVKIGIDIANIHDMDGLLKDSVGVFLTQSEWEKISSYPDVNLRLAGRFACKEAIMKLLGNGMDTVSFLDIEILNDRQGKPVAELKGTALHYWENGKFCCLDISISHHNDYAVAVAVGLCL